MLVETIKKIGEGTAPREKQGDNFSLAPMLDKKMAKIDFEKEINEIKNKVCGLNPIMGAYAMYKGKKIKFWKVEIVENNRINELVEKNIEEFENGEILIANDKQGLFVKAKGGVLKVLEVQRENSKRMNSCDFLRGNKISVKEKFE